MLFKGDQLKPAAAKKMGLIHEVAPEGEIVQRAKDWVKANPNAKAPWDDPKFKPPSGKVFSPTGMMIWPPANAIYRRETYDNYPAAKAILSSVFEGLQLPMDLALAVESKYFANILLSKEAAAMIRSLFLSMGELNKGVRRPANVPPTNLKKVGVLGAGLMGAGIAYVSANAGLEVVLIDRDQESADKGKAYADKVVSGQIAKGRAKPADKEALLARIHATADYEALKGCDFVVEAVFEDRAVKAEATKKAQAALGPDVVFASNTSTLPITSLAETSAKPEQFIGVHFFSPVEKMMLVEIIMGEKTDAKALATAMDFVRAIKKTPIVVNDCRGFYVNRCVINYMLEAHLMLMEGVPPAMIENVAKMAGLPVGPLALTDETGVDLAYKILKATEADLGAGAIDAGQKKLIETLVVKEQRFGRKNGKGFYDYPASGPKSLWPGLGRIAGKALDPDTISVQDLKDRFLFPPALEAARCMFEGVVTDPREADVGSILGFGYAPYTGGTLSFIDGMGLKAFVARARALAASHGPRFAPPEKLIEMAEKGQTFYGTYGEKIRRRRPPSTARSPPNAGSARILLHRPFDHAIASSPAPGAFGPRRFRLRSGTCRDRIEAGLLQRRRRGRRGEKGDQRLGGIGRLRIGRHRRRKHRDFLHLGWDAGRRGRRRRPAAARRPAGSRVPPRRVRPPPRPARRGSCAPCPSSRLRYRAAQRAGAGHRPRSRCRNRRRTSPSRARRGAPRAC